MKRIVGIQIICVSIIFGLAACVSTGIRSTAPIVCAPAPGAIGSNSETHEWQRTELYFGLSIPGGGEVSDDDWRQFVAAEICPRFPDGFTVLEANGTWRSDAGTMVGEASRVLLLLHSGSRDAAELDAIRDAYIHRFNQKSVMRVDQPAQVSF